MKLDLGFRCLVISVWAIETHASGSPGFVNVGTQHIPALAQMQHPWCRCAVQLLGVIPTFSFSGICRTPYRSLSGPAARLQKMSHSYGAHVGVRLIAAREGHVR